MVLHGLFIGLRVFRSFGSFGSFGSLVFCRSLGRPPNGRRGKGRLAVSGFVCVSRSRLRTFVVCRNARAVRGGRDGSWGLQGTRCLCVVRVMSQRVSGMQDQDQALRWIVVCLRAVWVGESDGRMEGCWCKAGLG